VIFEKKNLIISFYNLNSTQMSIKYTVIQRGEPGVTGGGTKNGMHR
jgi:hypothetical protein